MLLGTLYLTDAARYNFFKVVATADKHVLIKGIIPFFDACHLRCALTT